MKKNKPEMMIQIVPLLGISNFFKSEFFLSAKGNSKRLAAIRRQVPKTSGGSCDHRIREDAMDKLTIDAK